MNHLNFRISLVKNVSGLKKSFGHSLDILVVLCEMWHARPSDRRAARLF